VPQFLVLEDRTVLSVLTVTTNADGGTGSLRAAIAAAHGGDTIVFDRSLAHETITLSSGPLAVSSNLTIHGLGAKHLAISGKHASQLFTLSGTAQVTIADLTLTGGKSSQGGAILVGGTAALTLDGDILSGNQAVSDKNGNAFGGAVYSSAGTTLTIDNTSFVNNQTNGTNDSFGGALVNGGTLSINGATFTGNAALGSTNQSQGGAIGNQYGATATITLSTFTGNQALGSGTGSGTGGAIENGDELVTPPNGSIITTTLSQCTFANNAATGGSTAGVPFGGGGAIEDANNVNLAVRNCLFTDNQANSGGGVGAIGGAIDNLGADSTTISGSQFVSNSAVGSNPGASALAGAVDNFQTMTISNSSFTGNSALAGPMANGVTNDGQAVAGAILTLGSGTVLTLSNSIVADNEAVGGAGGSTLTLPVYTDSSFGGGINNGEGGTLNVTGCRITGNRAIGGDSAQGPGADAFGGGIRNDIDGTLNLSNSIVSANVSQGGAGASGYAGGIASGGGISNDRDSIATLTNSTISLNECLGGAGGADANGGLAVGGGVSQGTYPFAYGIDNPAWMIIPGPDTSSLVVSNCLIVGNTAQGGTAGSSAVGGEGLGGGIFVGSGTATLNGVLVIGDQAQGGAKGQGTTTGQGLGGGVYVDPSASATADMQTLIAGNRASTSNDDVWGTITIGP
jgi:hypothetical protein